MADEAESFTPPLVSYSKCSDNECEKYYEFGRVLGQGAFALVKLAKSREDGKRWAVKIMKKDALNAEDEVSLQNEISILASVCHDNVVQTRQVFDSPHYCFVVMECMSGGELFDRIVEREHYSELQAKEAFSQMVVAIRYCHEKGIVHRDLKPENLLYADGSENAVLKLADFGLAQIIKPSELMHHACGTPGYIAPEMLRNEAYGPPVDLWSLGVILYILVCGFPPFYDEDERELYDTIKKAQYEFISPYWDDASEQVKDLIEKMLELDPAKRLTADQVLDHEWLSETFPHKTEHKVAAIQQMRKYNARRRLKGAVRAIMATNAIRALANG
jgi:serine/threonine protein kinase